MCDVLVWSLDAIRWPETLGALASVVTAAIAFYALQTWKHQDKANREAKFLDAVIEASHTYIAEIHKPVAILEMVNIGMKCHAPTWESGEQTDIAVKGAVTYIEKNGENDGKRLLEVLEAVQPSVIRLRSLAATGQVFRFDDYAKCQNAIAMLTWQFDRVEALMGFIHTPSWNWENPVVLRLLRDLMSINPDEIRADIKASNIALLEFVTEAYQLIYR